MHTVFLFTDLMCCIKTSIEISLWTSRNLLSDAVSRSCPENWWKGCSKTILWAKAGKEELLWEKKRSQKTQHHMSLHRTSRATTEHSAALQQLLFQGQGLFLILLSLRHKIQTKAFHPRFQLLLQHSSTALDTLSSQRQNSLLGCRVKLMVWTVNVIRLYDPQPWPSSPKLKGLWTTFKRNTMIKTPWLIPPWRTMKP